MPHTDPIKSKQYKAAWHKENRARVNSKRRLRYIEGDRFRIYGITPEEFRDKFVEQDGKCAICHTDLEYIGKNTCIDHDHTTGKFRGILCRGCNVGLGNFYDDELLLQGAIEYLRRYDGLV